jgi:hypothetical protein
MNGDISVDIEPIHRTTGHKSAAFVGGYNTIGAPTRMTWSLNAGLSKFSVMLRDTDNGTGYKVHFNNFRMRGHFPVNFKIMHFSISGIHVWPLKAL